MSAEADRQPPWLRIAADLRRQIATDDLSVGALIPPSQKLADKYGVAKATVQKATSLLQDEGVLASQHGIGIVVVRKPDSTGPQPRVGDLAKTVTELRTSLERVTVAIDAVDLGRLRGEVNDLRAQLSQLQTHLIDLYGRLGQPYPNGHTGADQNRRHA